MNSTYSLQGNIWKYAVLLISNKRIFVAILGVYYLTVPGVTAKTIGLILSVSQLSAFVFEIPSGYVSDKIGHKQALVTARILMLLSTIFFLFAESIPFLFLGGIFMSVAIAFHSGTGSAFMHETLKSLGRDSEYPSVMGKVSSIGFAVPIAFMAAAPFLVSISYKLPFLISLFIDAFGLAVAFTLAKPPVSQEHIEEIGMTNFRQVLKEGYRLKYFTVALFSGIVSGVLLSIGGFREPYQAVLGVSVTWFGVLFGAGRVFASILLAYSSKISNVVTPTTFYRMQLIGYPLLLCSLGVVSVWWVVVAIFIVINAFQWGLGKIDEGYQLDIIRSSKFKATLLSVESQIGQVAAAVSAAAVGLVIERVSYQYGFMLLGIVLAIVLLPLYVRVSSRYRTGVYTISK